MMSGTMVTALPTDDLGALEVQLWAELVAAAHARGHAWRTPVLATAGGAAGVDARVVVLREVDAPARELVFFTDARSPKAAQIDAHPQATMVMWSAELGWQLRLTVHLVLETSGLAVSSRWATLKMTPAAQDYLSPLPPGAPLRAHPAPERGSREHFAVVTAQVRVMDWLALDPAGHRRAVFDGHGARWVQP
ncbi:MAG TPA: pyridoxamine 5'-phosphate oxidase family protein [Ideonella sp.]|uniref:pyridoxamine 5'-phosphate oxidase family protein n=1 Tax=Ideonella sp. TaxID=1929293 RepID=UPI002E374625|nr:pyridoxamine 5'-phosphate oxidase family protein [Ideonella sp.]HEX5686700.1 pyridoxamine 5'-phosphate oxidase family protein [Ideonella sp.]